jgi:hypothetical protein
MARNYKIFNARDAHGNRGSITYWGTFGFLTRYCAILTSEDPKGSYMFSVLV